MTAPSTTPPHVRGRTQACMCCAKPTPDHRPRVIAASPPPVASSSPFSTATTSGLPTASLPQLAILNSHPDVGLVCGDCAIFDGDATVLESFFDDAGLDAVFWGDPVRVIDPFAKLFRLNYLATGSLLIRRECLERCGGFDETMRLVEDLELWLRLARQCRFAYTRELCQRKRRHAHNVSADSQAMTLAYVRLLERQQRLHGKELRAKGIRVGPRIALEYCLLGDSCARGDDFKAARDWYLRALRRSPALRPAWYWLRSWLPTTRPASAP